MSSCKTCGGSDHVRASSSKCLFYKPPIRKRKLAESQPGQEDLAIVTVKRGLANFIKDRENKNDLLVAVRNDVRELSRLFVELGTLANYVYVKFWSLYGTDRFATAFTRPNILGLTYVLKGRIDYFSDQDVRNVINDYVHIRSSTLTDGWYNGRLRSFVIQELAKSYATSTMNNVQIHAYSRFRRFAKDVCGVAKTRIKAVCFDAYYERKFTADCPDSLKTIVNAGIYHKRVASSTEWWSTVPIWLDVREQLVRRGKKGFRIFSIPSHGLKHLTYTSRGWHELLRRVTPSEIPSSWSTIQDPETVLWTPWVNTVFSSNNDKCFGCSIQTDGRSVSISYTKRVPKKRFKVKTVNLDVPSTNYVGRTLAVDPGSRKPLVVYDDTTQTFVGVSKKFVRSHTLEWRRERTRRRTGCVAIEKEEQRDRKAKERELGYSLSYRSASCVDETTKFRLKWFSRRQEPYDLNPKLTRCKLEKYIYDAKCTKLVADRVLGKDEADTRILYGAGSNFMNASTTMRGRKFAHDRLIALLRRRVSSVDIVDESFTSKYCARCVESSGELTEIFFPKRSRYQLCKKCGNGIDRDENGALNIYNKHVAKVGILPNFRLWSPDTSSSSAVSTTNNLQGLFS